jgi:hypothetical protein
MSGALHWHGGCHGPNCYCVVVLWFDCRRATGGIKCPVARMFLCHGGARRATHGWDEGTVGVNQIPSRIELVA